MGGREEHVRHFPKLQLALGDWIEAGAARDEHHAEAE